AKTVTFWGQANQSVTMTWNDLSAECVQPDPVVETRPSTSAPSIPAGMKCACMVDQQSTAINPNCPVIVYKGKTFWAFSYIDNRMSMGIVAYDASGKVCTTWEKPGARYVYKITVDNTAKTVTFWGQANQSVTMTWAELSM
ncbi:MAG: hypothetical protein HXX16_18260, partial [Bacteroidales bacterium]|nr:hypothetical protein [Bacteroidales bacterium]